MIVKASVGIPHIWTIMEWKMQRTQKLMTKEDNHMKLTYTQTGDYLIPKLMLSEETQEIPGKYGMLRKTYLKTHRGGTYQALLLSGKLNQHLLEIDRTANSRMEQIVAQMLQTNPAPDKAANQMGWVQHMNALTQQAEEIVLQELVYH